MHWFIIGRKAFYRMRCVLKTAFIAVLLVAFSISVVGARYERELYLEAAKSEENSKIIIIDAGHGGEDSGAVGATGVLEKDLNMQISLALADSLSAKGYTAVMTRTEDKLLYTEAENIKGLRKIYDLKNRCKIANQYPNALFISIHMNSYSEAKYSGLQAYYTDKDDESRALAGMIQSKVKSELQTENKRQTKNGKNIYLLENTEPTAVLIECGFITNTEECNKLADAEYQKRLSELIASAIIEYKEGKTV